MRHENVNQLGFLVHTFEFHLKKEQGVSCAKKIEFVVDHLRSKDKMRELVLKYSAFNYGAHLLNSVFPKYDNPEEFHSKDGIVCLDEHPVQVMGWKEYEEQIELGVSSMGLDRNYIIWGFNQQAEERGIDLEWHFSAEAPTKPNTPAALRGRGRV